MAGEQRGAADTTWAGVDVGGWRKGFHAAVIDAAGVCGGPLRLATPADVAAWLAPFRPVLVAVDSPLAAAPDGLRSRPDERTLARRVCGIRYTPDAVALGGNPYYEWIRHGLELYAALRQAGLTAVECFPTASWTRWIGPRRPGQSRAAWSALALAGQGLHGVVTGRLGQDGRDALGAALTARAHGFGLTEAFGAIVVPR
jgi:predicted nuclease with RNAse H fold